MSHHNKNDEDIKKLLKMMNKLRRNDVRHVVRDEPKSGPSTSEWEEQWESMGS